MNRHSQSAIDDAHESNPQLAEWLEDSFYWCSPLHHLDIITLARTLELLEGGADIHLVDARAPHLARLSPLDIARDLKLAGLTPAGSPAALVLRHWHERLYALACGTHGRLGSDSAVLKLAGLPEVCMIIASFAALARSPEEPAMAALGAAMATVGLEESGGQALAAMHPEVS